MGCKTGPLAGRIAGTLHAGGVHGQNKAIGFKPGAPFSEGQIAGNTLYVAGQQGPDANGKVTGTDITVQTTNAIGAIEKVVKKGRLQNGGIWTSSPSPS